MDHFIAPRCFDGGIYVKKLLYILIVQYKYLRAITILDFSTFIGHQMFIIIA